MENIVFSKEQFEEFLKERSDEIVGKVLSNLDSFKINNDILKNQIKNSIHQSFRDFLPKLIAFLLGYNSFEFEFKKPSNNK